MIRLLMAGTALAAVLATSAFAQSSSSMMDASSMTSSSAMTDTSASGMTSASDMTSSSAMAPSQDMSSSAMAPSATSSMETSSSASAPMANPQFTILSGYTQVSTDRLASTVMGAHVYDGAAQDSNDLGKINDLVLNENGSIAAVVLGVGGFLGIGEKQVAVDYHALQWEVGPDNNRRFVLQTTKDELTNAPDFKTVSPDQASSAANTNGVPGPASDNAMGANASSSAM